MSAPVRSLAERLERMRDATIERIRESPDGDDTWTVTAPGSRTHELTTLPIRTHAHAVSCDCEAFQFNRDEPCVHMARLDQHLKETRPMTTDLTTTNGTGLAALPSTTHELRQQNQAFRDIVRSSFARSAPDEVLDFVAGYCRATGLNLFAGHVNVIKRADLWTVGPSINGLIHIAERTGSYDGITDEEWCDAAGNWNSVWLSTEVPPTAARCKVHRKGVSHPFTGTATWQGFAQYKNDGALMAKWATAGPEMLGKCALAQALRKAFPQSDGTGAPQEWRCTVPDDIQDRTVIGDNADGGVIEAQFTQPAPLPVVQTAGNGVSTEADEIRTRLLQKSRKVPKPIWKEYFAENAKTWSDCSLNVLRQAETSIDGVIATATAENSRALQAEAPLDEPRTDGPDDPALDPFAE